MPHIALVIGDNALASAVIEQLQTAGLGEAAAMDMAAAYRDAGVALIVADAAGYGKKPIKNLSDPSDPLKPVLLLGQAAAGSEGSFDEILPLPLRIGQLLERLRYHLETAPRLRARVSIFGGFRLEPHNRQLVVIETEAVVRLTEKETALLVFLAHSDTPVSRDGLLSAIWGYDKGIDTHTLETHIYQLRRKLDPDGRGNLLLINEQGFYRLER